MTEEALQLAQVVSTAASVLALLMIWVQLRYQSRQVEFECLTHLHQELLAAPMQEALRFVHSCDAHDLLHPKTEGDLEKIEIVLNTFDLVGFRVRKGVIPKKATLETEWMILLPLWSKISPFIEEQRRRRANNLYKQNLEWLVKRPILLKRDITLIMSLLVSSGSLAAGRQ